MKHDFRIRECRRDDLDKISELERICFPSSPALPMVALVQYFDLFQNTFVVAEHQNTLIGFAIAGSRSLDPKSAWLLDAAVLEPYRKLGVASSMLTELIYRLRNFGTKSVKATVSIKNTASRRMLEKSGFRAIQETDEYFGKGEPRLILKELRLE